MNEENPMVTEYEAPRRIFSSKYYADDEEDQSDIKTLDSDLTTEDILYSDSIAEADLPETGLFSEDILIEPEDIIDEDIDLYQSDKTTAEKSPINTSELWIIYKQTHSPAVRDELITHYAGIVRMIARRMCDVYKNYADLDDIVGQGILVLIDAIEKFDPERGVKFETFASVKIRGSVIDYIRKQDWVPRNLRKKARDIQTTQDQMNNELGREATEDEVARQMGFSVNEINSVLMQTHSFHLLSYEELLSESQLLSEKTPASDERPENRLFDSELRKVIASSIDLLNEKERLVVSLYYYEELKLKEIAQIMSLTDARVCQIHSKALIKLKGALKSYINN